MERVTLGLDTSGRPLVLDTRTLAKLRHAEKALGFTFTIVQGSYRGGSGAAASAGTHDGGGVIDLRTWNLPAHITPAEAVRRLRLSGLIAWYRHAGQGFDPHIHAIDYGNPALDPSAAAQVRMWEQGYNGLASWGRDDGPRVTVPLDPPKPAPEGFTMDKEAREAFAALNAKVDGIAADVARSKQFLANSRKRELLTNSRLKSLGLTAEQIQAVLDEADGGDSGEA